MASQGWNANSFLNDNSAGDDGRLHSALDLVAALCIAASLLFFAVGWAHGPIYAKWLPVGALAVVVLIKLGLLAARNSIAFDVIDGFALALLAWVATSLVWSADRLGGYDTLIKWALLTATFIGVRHGYTPATHRTFGVAVAAGLIGIIAMDRLGIAGLGGYFNQNYETEAILLGLPFLLIFNSSETPTWQRWASRVLAALTIVFLVFANASKIEFFVWAVIGMFFSLTLLWQRSKLQALGALALVGAAAGLLAYFGWDRPLFNESHGIRESVYPRLELLANGIAMWKDAPLFGHGAGFMYPVYPLYQEHYLQILGSDYKTALLTGFYTSAGALHNDYIQFMAGFGLVGLLIVTAGAIAAKRLLRGWNTDPARIAGAVVVVGCLANAAVDFPLQNAASALLAVLGLAWLLGERPTATGEQQSLPVRTRLRIIPMLAAIVALPAVGWWAYRYYIGHDAFGAALRMGNSRPDVSLQLNLGAVGAYPLDDAFRYQLYTTLMFMEENAGRPVAPPAVHDQLFATGLTAGPGNALMIFRLEYLLNSGRYKEQAEEVAKWRKQLTTNVTRLPDTWLMEGLYEVADNRPDKAKAALDRYLELTGGKVGDDRRAIVETIRRAIAP